MTLDNPNETLDPKSVSAWPVSLRFGVIGALIGIALSMVMYTTGMMDPTQQNWGPFFISLAINFGILYFAVQQHKEELGGYISFGRIVLLGLLIGLIMGLISAVWNYIFFAVVAPDIIEMILDNTVTQMQEQGSSDEEIEMAMSFTRPMMQPWFFAIVAVPSTIISMLIIGLISGAFLKQDAPETV